MKGIYMVDADMGFVQYLENLIFQNTTEYKVLGHSFKANDFLIKIQNKPELLKKIDLLFVNPKLNDMNGLELIKKVQGYRKDIDVCIVINENIKNFFMNDISELGIENIMIYPNDDEYFLSSIKQTFDKAENLGSASDMRQTLMNSNSSVGTNVAKVSESGEKDVFDFLSSDGFLNQFDFDSLSDEVLKGERDEVKMPSNSERASSDLFTPIEKSDDLDKKRDILKTFDFNSAKDDWSVDSQRQTEDYVVPRGSFVTDERPAQREPERKQDFISGFFEEKKEMPFDLKELELGNSGKNNNKINDDYNPASYVDDIYEQDDSFEKYSVKDTAKKTFSFDDFAKEDVSEAEGNEFTAPYSFGHQFDKPEENISPKYGFADDGDDDDYLQIDDNHSSPKNNDPYSSQRYGFIEEDVATTRGFDAFDGNSGFHKGFDKPSFADETGRGYEQSRRDEMPGIENHSYQNDSFDTVNMDEKPYANPYANKFVEPVPAVEKGEDSTPFSRLPEISPLGKGGSQPAFGGYEHSPSNAREEKPYYGTEFPNSYEKTGRGASSENLYGAEKKDFDFEDRFKPSIDEPDDAFDYKKPSAQPDPYPRNSGYQSGSQPFEERNEEYEKKSSYTPYPSNQPIVEAQGNQQQIRDIYEHSGVNDLSFNPTASDHRATQGGYVKGGNINAVPDFAKQIIAFYSVKGGIGKTSLAINTTIQLAKYSKKKVCLVDFDLTNANVHTHLGMLDVRYDLSEIANFESEIDSYSIGKIITKYSTKDKNGDAVEFDVLVGFKKMTMLQRFNEKEVHKILTILEDMYDVVIVDTHPVYTDVAISTILNKATKIVFVAEQEMTALNGATDFILASKNYGIPKEKLFLVLNRYTTNTSIFTKARIEKSLGKEVMAVVPFDIDALREAVNTNNPITISTPDGNLSKAYVDIAKIIDKNIEVPESKGFFGKFKK